MRSAARQTMLACLCTFLLAVTLAAGQQGRAAVARPSPTRGFGQAIGRLSEPGGAFDTDNLISNERSYLEVVPGLTSRGVTGGAYIGVGPDQNFSYIARVRPSVAYILDIRRDNLLLHLLFKSLFAESKTRVEYLCLLTGRSPPAEAPRWNTASLKAIVAYVDGAAALPDSARALRRRLDDVIAGFGVTLSRADLDTIDRFHRAFIDAGLGLQFHSFNRPPQFYYPTLRDLILATDAAGHPWNYLAAEDDFQFLRTLEGRDLLIPVVGDVAGPHALRAIGTAIADRGEQLSAFYISNVENYLFRDGTFARFADNLSRVPRSPKSVIIRSIFSGAGDSVSRLQSLDQMMTDVSRSSYRTYSDLLRAVER